MAAADITAGPAKDEPFHFEVLWNRFSEFEEVVFSQQTQSFSDFVIMWKSRLAVAAELGLCYPDNILAFKLLRQSNMAPESRRCILAALQSRTEANRNNLLIEVTGLLAKLYEESDYNEPDNDALNKEQFTDDLQYKSTEDYLEREDTENVSVLDFVQVMDEELGPVVKLYGESQTISKKKRLKCDECIKTFSTQIQLSKHTKICHNNPTECVKCNKTFTSASKLELHMRSHHRDHKCTECDELLPNSSSLNEHKKMHKKLFLCEVCFKEFGNANKLRFHITMMHKEKLHKCDECQSVHATEKLLNTHMKEHSWFQCDQCGKDVLGFKNLGIHTRTHLKWKCIPCQAFFTSKEKLETHEKNHKSFTCDMCAQTFTKFCWLQRHLNTVMHGGQKSFQCDQCEKSFNRKEKLMVHKLVHDGIRNFQCEHCERAFYTKETLKRHVRIHTGEKPYECDFCRKRFTQSGDLSKHRKTHQMLL